MTKNIPDSNKYYTVESLRIALEKNILPKVKDYKDIEKIKEDLTNIYVSFGINYNKSLAKIEQNISELKSQINQNEPTEVSFFDSLQKESDSCRELPTMGG